MRKFIVRVVVALVVLCGASFYVYKANDVNETYENKENNNESNMLSMMLETSMGSGEYQQSTASAWPTEGYTFNENLSKCEKGSKLSWDSTNKTVVMTGNVSDKCYVYFDNHNKPSIADYCNSEDPLADCIVEFADQGSEISSIYIHDSNLENGAGDDSYRYAGPSETTDNFVCLVADEDDECSTDDLYRIIGVFDGYVKLIKYDYLKSEFLEKTYESTSLNGTNKGNNSLSEVGASLWGYSYTTWNNAVINIRYLNASYLSDLESRVSSSSLIYNYAWISSGNNLADLNSVVGAEAYENEITSHSGETTYNSNIGLMYVSDYAFAADPSAWTSQLYDYDNFIDVNWMYMGLYDWTITRTDGGVFTIWPNGYVMYNSYGSYGASRPTFYLDTNAVYIKGKGTIDSPMIVMDDNYI